MWTHSNWNLHCNSETISVADHHQQRSNSWNIWDCESFFYILLDFSHPAYSVDISILCFFSVYIPAIIKTCWETNSKWKTETWIITTKHKKGRRFKRVENSFVPFIFSLSTRVLYYFLLYVQQILHFELQCVMKRKYFYFPQEFFALPRLYLWISVNFSYVVIEVNVHKWHYKCKDWVKKWIENMLLILSLQSFDEMRFSVFIVNMTQCVNSNTHVHSVVQSESSKITIQCWMKVMKKLKLKLKNSAYLWYIFSLCTF